MKRKSKGITEAQRKARERNHLIFRLRGAWTLLRGLGNKEGMDAINYELKKLNAETQEEAWDRIEKEMM